MSDRELGGSWSCQILPLKLVPPLVFLKFDGEGNSAEVVTDEP